MAQHTSPVAARNRRRLLLALVAAQLVGGAGLAAAVAVGGIIAVDLAGPGVAGLPLSTAVAGTGLSALLLGRLTQRRGRRYGLRWGWQIGMGGAALATVACATRSLPLLVVAMLLFGAGEAASAASRFAAADLPGRRGTAMGTVLAATALSATLGPLLVAPAAAWAPRLGLPPLAGPFLLAAVAFSMAGTVVGAALRPDPRPAIPTTDEGRRERDTRTISLLMQPAVRPGLYALAVANVVMLGIMTVAPVHIAHADAHAEAGALPAIGLILSLHVAGMFAPSPVTGWLADRVGGPPVLAMGGLTLAASALLLTQVGSHGSGVLTLALLLLGVGWNLAFVGGSLMLTDATADHDRPRVQAAADATMGIAGVTGSGLSGLILAAGGLPAVGLVAAAVSATLVLVVTRRSMRPRRSDISPAPTGATLSEPATVA